MQKWNRDRRSCDAVVNSCNDLMVQCCIAYRLGWFSAKFDAQIDATVVKRRRDKTPPLSSIDDLEFTLCCALASS